MMTDSNLGCLLANRYQLAELIGRGAMGRVYRAEDVLLGGVVAVKFLSQTLLNRRMRDRFKTEARTCAQLGQKSIHIVRVMDYGVNDEEVPFYVMEYLQGDSLNEVINDRPLPLPRFLGLARQICLGLQCAHEGIKIEGNVYPIIHRDIKPSNILVSQDASLGELVKILDFGISKLLQADSGQTSSYMGTLAYSSPEQMEGRELDSRSDIYSLGVMMFEMLTGKMPLQAETHSFGSWYKTHHFQPPHSFDAINTNLKLPKVLENLVMSCLAKAAKDRPQTIDEILKALEPLEQRYSAHRHLTQRLETILANRPTNGSTQSQNTLTAEEVSRFVTWPKDKPIAQIVFPQVFRTARETVAALWIMLPQAEIETLQVSRLYNRVYRNFLCSMTPHPMILWMTAIYNRFHHLEKGPRWLRCYLDLKTNQGQEMLRLLGERGHYQVMFFSLEEPHTCAHIMPVMLPPSQCDLLKEWAITSQTWTAIGQPTISKNLLQAEFEKIKPKIVAELEKQSSNHSIYLAEDK